MVTLTDEKIKQAISHFKSGRYQLALQLAEQMIPQTPDNIALLSMAAVSSRELNYLEKAEIYFRALIRAKPSMGAAYNDLGMLLIKLGRLLEAEVMYEKALVIDPGLAPAYVNLGNLMRQTNKLEKAESAYLKAIELQPGHIDALYNLGLLMIEQNRKLEAEAVFRQSLAIEPNQADVYISLGALLAEERRNAEAETAFTEATRINPKSAEGHFNLALLHCDSLRYKEALASLRKSLDAQPNHANALNCFGNIMSNTGNFEKAEMAYRRALELSPDSANLHNNLGNLWMVMDKPLAAEKEFRHAFALEGDYGYALGQAASCARKCYSWQNFESDNDTILNLIERGVTGVPALMVQSLLNATPLQLRKAGTLDSKNKIQPYIERQPLVPLSQHLVCERLRIGYLSADFREHAVMHLATKVIENHDRSGYGIHAYSLGPNTRDHYRQRIEATCEVFRDLSRSSSEAVARQIVDDGIDILIDLSGYTTGARPEVAAMRPAPLIVNWLGFPGSMGHPRLADYLIGDSVLTPLDHQESYSETLALLPDCYVPIDGAISITQAQSRKASGLPEEAFVFCSFNQAYKLNPETFSIWCRLLDAIPGSVLWLLEPKETSASANLQREAETRNIAPERLIFAPFMPMKEHLDRLTLADLVLDTFPYGSGATGATVLNAGIPMVTRQGATYVSRMAASQLHAAGVPELITDSWEGYFSLAKALALDKERLTQLRAKLANNRSTAPLFDTKRFTRNLEALFSRMWRDHAAGVRTPIILSEA